MNKTRLEAFSDGVIAIIITIMVLEIKVPHSADWMSLEPLLPVILSYVLSFAFVGIYWGNHHHLLHTVRYVTSGIIWANLHLLFWLSMVPVATNWMGETHFATNPVIAYAVVLMLCGIAYTILQVIIQKSNVRHPELEQAFEGVKKKGIISILLCGAAIPFAYVHTGISCALLFIVAAIWFIPDRNLERALTNHEQKS
ncbi:TMEM175 family protein [Chitinophagaceae bacterium MMS25-I14]